MNKRKNFFIDMLLVLFIFFLIFVSYKLYRNYHDYISIKELLNKVNDNNYKGELLDFKNKNNDIVGIIEIDNTEYRTFFVQGKDNKEYLAKNIYKKKDRRGTPFLDYQVNIDSKKLIIYGHSSRYLDLSFNILNNYYDEDFYKSNRIINIKTENDVRKYEIISVFTETSDWSYQKVIFDNDDEFNENINTLINKSIFKEYHKYDGEQILVLQTCSKNENYKQYKRKYLIIVARRIEL